MGWMAGVFLSRAEFLAALARASRFGAGEGFTAVIFVP